MMLTNQLFIIATPLRCNFYLLVLLFVVVIVVVAVVVVRQSPNFFIIKFITPTETLIIEKSYLEIVVAIQLTVGTICY